jgi:hypothetical protein
LIKLILGRYVLLRQGAKSPDFSLKKATAAVHAGHDALEFLFLQPQNGIFDCCNVFTLADTGTDFRDPGESAGHFSRQPGIVAADDGSGYVQSWREDSHFDVHDFYRRRGRTVLRRRRSRDEYRKRNKASGNLHQ